MDKYVINLPHRVERLARFKEEIKYLFDDEIHVSSGVVKPIIYHGIADAHLAVIRKAKEANLKEVLIMEDDIYIPGKERGKEHMLKCFDNLPSDWDVLLGGVYWSKALAPYNKYWNKTLEFAALHFYVVNQKAYDKILSYDYTQHIDRWIGQSGLNCYVPSKFFAIQYDGFSDNVQKETKYNEKYLHPYKIVK